MGRRAMGRRAIWRRAMGRRAMGRRGPVRMVMVRRRRRMGMMMRTASPLAAHLPRRALQLALGLAPLALLLPAALLHLAAELPAVALLLFFERLPVAQEVFDLAAEGGLIQLCGVDGGLFGGLELVPHELDLVPGDGLVRALQPLLEVLLGDGQLGVAEVVVVGERTDGRFRTGR
jgi:hypothetical protein